MARHSNPLSQKFHKLYSEFKVMRAEIEDAKRVPAAKRAKFEKLRKAFRKASREYNATLRAKRKRRAAARATMAPVAKAAAPIRHKGQAVGDATIKAAVSKMTPDVAARLLAQLIKKFATAD